MENPPGTVHAIGAGNLILEIQTPEDETLRLSDWGRNGTDGLPRPLQRAAALACCDPALRPVPRPPLDTPRTADWRNLSLQLPPAKGRTASVSGDGWQIDIEWNEELQLELSCSPDLLRK